jgi:hypothetical protein
MLVFDDRDRVFDDEALAVLRAALDDSTPRVIPELKSICRDGGAS